MTFNCRIARTGKGGLAYEKRLGCSMTVATIKDKIYPLLGIAPGSQNLTLCDASDKPVAALSNENDTLEQYYPQDNWLILVRTCVCVVMMSRWRISLEPVGNLKMFHV